MSLIIFFLLNKPEFLDDRINRCSD